MFGRARAEAPEDPLVDRIEAILGLVAGSGSTALQAPEATPIVTNALWICACVTFDAAPTWLIHDGEGRVSWCRVPAGVEPLDLVHPHTSAGGHADPTEVLRWLEGKAPDPWGNGGNGTGDAAAVEGFGRRIQDELTRLGWK
jgi:hypothetical protein